MQTRNYLITAFCLLISGFVTSADKYVVAKIILANNDTVVNLVKYTQLHYMQEKIEIKVNDSISNTLYPMDVKSFYTLAGKGDTIRFESNCGLRLGMADNFDNSCYFMLKLRNGKIPLYYFSLSKLMRLGLSMETVQQPAYVTKLNNVWLLMESNNYVNQLEKLMKQYIRKAKNEELKLLKGLESKLLYDNYKFDDMPAFFNDLNDILQ